MITYSIPNDASGQPRSDTVLRLPDLAWIPPEESNADYVAYQEWLTAGNTPTPWHPVEGTWAWDEASGSWVEVAPES